MRKNPVPVLISVAAIVIAMIALLRPELSGASNPADGSTAWLFWSIIALVGVLVAIGVGVVLINYFVLSPDASRRYEQRRARREGRTSNIKTDTTRQGDDQR